MSGRELYKIMIKNDLDFAIDKIIEKNNDLTIKELKIEELEQKVEQLEKENKELKQPQVYIDCENMEERYGRDLYEDYLKEKIEQLENIRKEIKEYIEKQVVCCKNSDMLVELNVDDLLNILNKGE